MVHTSDSYSEALSERERAVLGLLATPRTYMQIARELYISRNTVKTHVSNVYAKLGVSTRYEAIERARAMGMLPDDDSLDGEHLRCEALLRSSPDLVIVVGPDHRIFCANRTLAEMLGHEGDVHVGRELYPLIHPGDRARARARFADAVRSPSEAVAFDCRFARADGSFRNLDVRLINRLDDPAVRGFVLYARDSTDRRTPALRRVEMKQPVDAVQRHARELRHQSMMARASARALLARGTMLYNKTATLVRPKPSAPRDLRSPSYVATPATGSDRDRS